MLRNALGTRIGERIHSEHPALLWLVAHASNMINKFQIGKDGRAAYQIWKGKHFKRPIPEFGERVLCLKADTRGKDKG